MSGRRVLVVLLVLFTTACSSMSFAPQTSSGSLGPVKLLDWKVYRQGEESCRVAGAVRNDGPHFVGDIRVRVALFMEDEQVAEQIVEVEKDGLFPYQSTTFEAAFNYAPLFTDCSVRILNYEQDERTQMTHRK